MRRREGGAGPTELSRSIVAGPVGTLDWADRERIRQQLVAGVTGEVVRLPEDEELEIDLSMVRRALARPDFLLGPDEPFAWQPKFVRRSLGLAVVGACVEGRFRSPAEAVRTVASEAVDEWALTGWKTFYWEPWFAGLPPPGQAMVLAEAVSWSTALWTALDWSVLGPGLRFGGAGDGWVLPVPRRVRLKSRCELRAVTGPAGHQGETASRPPSFVTVSSGSPSPAWSEELAFLALPALRADSVPLPARVTGLWPEAGAHRVLEIDRPALERAVERVVRAVTTLVDIRVSALASP